MTLQISNKTKDIMSYESDVWAAADVLRGSVGLKNSEFPDYMMPFFALRMVESRLVRAYVQTKNDPDLITESDVIEEVKHNFSFYNSVIVEKHQTLADIVKNDKTFASEFTEYLNSFNDELKSLLGIVGGNRAENLNISAVIETLRKTGVLFGYAKAWAEVDFTPYDNAEITTLEEHIKRKWADMSAETAGEQYTPFDIIALIARLCAIGQKDMNKPYKVYDMTCGGGNMLYGVEDILKKKYPNIHVETYGQELRGSLYALARIESMFRQNANIEHGNTLTNEKFPEHQFDYGVANPPYGVDWKDAKKSVENDQTGRFGHGGYPSVSDGQLLFVQNMVAKLNESGKAYIVLNGSPMFSGDAGSGESNIRKWLMDNDYVEGFIQLPTNEFFNTGITTYLWCLSKDKPADKKDKIICINAEDMFENMKKNVGNKSRKLTDDAIEDIADMFEHFKETDKSKVLSKYHFYFNKQSLRKLEIDEQFGAFNNGVIQKPFKQEDVCFISIKDIATQQFVEQIRIKNQDLTNDDLTRINEAFSNVDLSEKKIIVSTDFDECYHIDENNCIWKETISDPVAKNLGYGEIKIKASLKKATAKQAERVVVEVSINPVWTKDDEKIAYSPNEEENQKLISDFMTKWVSEEATKYQLLDNSIGVEVNFNNIFPKKIIIRSTKDILAEIAALDKEMEGE